MRVVLKDTEDVWNKLFQERGETYQEPGLVLFSGVDNQDAGRQARRWVHFTVRRTQRFILT